MSILKKIFDAFRATVVRIPECAFLTDRSYYCSFSWQDRHYSLRVLLTLQKMYVWWFPVSSATLAGLHWLAHQGYVFFSAALQENNATSLPYLPIIINSKQEALISSCDGFYFGSESPTFQIELIDEYPSKALLLIAEQNTECIIGSAFCLIINNNNVRFAVNLDALSRSGVKVNPDVLMLARKKNDG